MNDTTKAILELLTREMNETSYEYSRAEKRMWGEVFRDMNTAKVLLTYLLREACEIAGVEREHHTAETGDLEFDVYSIIYPSETEADETTAKMVVEPCPHCESEIEMEWDVKTQGYKATCPVCGNLLMLCDECQHRGEDGEDLDDCDFDGRDGSCRFNPKGNVGNSQDSNRVYCPVLGGWIMRYDACRGGCEYDSETDTCKLYRNNTQKGGDDRNG